MLSRFAIRQGEKGGLLLDVDFTPEANAVWLRKGKTFIRKQLDTGLTLKYQGELEEIMMGASKRDWVHNNPAFPFRYGNGGTLPVIRYGNKDYYCMFYREIHPIGWNIANGGAESVSELLNPFATIERELREELIIFDLDKKFQYIFNWSEGRRMDHPDFAIANRVWREIFKKENIEELSELPLPLKWLSGNDCVKINYDGHIVEFNDCIVNVNAEDFGIEVDRVAKLSVSEGAVFCDGELINGKLLNQIVGLFDVEKVNSQLLIGKYEFIPDLYFWSGKNRTGDEFPKVVDDFFNYLGREGLKDVNVRQNWEQAPVKFDLCPVSKNIIRRYMYMNPLHQEPEAVDQPDVFLSFASEDYETALEVYRYLTEAGKKVFFSKESLHISNFGEAIDEAIYDSKALVVVGSDSDSLFKPWVRYECLAFLNHIRAGRKPWESPIVTIVNKPADRSSLPKALLNYKIIEYDPEKKPRSFKDLHQVV